jgi:hypothetical protein
MSYQQVLAGLALIASLLPAGPAWTGAPQGNTCVRESMLAHVCVGGANHGAQCEVHWNGQTPCGLVTDSPGCPGGQCLIAYTSPEITTQLSVMVDQNVTPWNPPLRVLSQRKALTFLLCGSRAGQPYCFTETYQAEDPTALPYVGGVTENSLTSPFIDKPYLLERWQFFAPEGVLNPQSALAQGLRNLFQVTGIPVITGIGAADSIRIDKHTGDRTGSVLRFTVKLRFVRGKA